MATPKPKVGVVALQGDFPLHKARLEELAAEVALVREPSELISLQAIIIPGGESTTLSKLGWENGLWEEIIRLGNNGMPIMGTCAGLILLAKKALDGGHKVKLLGLLDITVRRNAYGSQVNSFETILSVNADGEKAMIRGVFIRAPKIVEVGEGVDVLGVLNGSPVFVSRGHIWGLTFHPELAEESFLHKKFLEVALSGVR